jgi:hypothetical protein
VRAWRSLPETARATCRAAVAETDAWAESADAFAGEQAARCQSVRERIAAAAGETSSAPAEVLARVQTVTPLMRDGELTGLRIGLADGSELELERGASAGGIRLVELSRHSLDPIARVEVGGERLVLFPYSGWWYRDWPRVPRAVWIEERFGPEGSRECLRIRDELLRALPGLNHGLPQELMKRILPKPWELGVEFELTPADLELIAKAARETPAEGLHGDPALVCAWLAPGIVLAGEVDLEERYWTSLARTCREGTDEDRRTILPALPDLLGMERQPWMRAADPVTSWSIQPALERARFLELARAFLAE